MKAGKVEPILKSSRDGKVAQQCIHEYFNLFTNIYTLHLNHTQTKYRRLIFTLKWNYLFGSFLGSHNIITILSQGSFLVLIIRSAMGLLDQSKFLATYQTKTKNNKMKIFYLFIMTFLWIRVWYHFMYQDMVSSAVCSLPSELFVKRNKMYCTQKLGAHGCVGVEAYREFMLSDRRRSWGLTRKSSARW